jgi:hypothetical protein
MGALTCDFDCGMALFDAVRSAGVVLAGSWERPREKDSALGAIFLTMEHSKEARLT